MKRIIPGVASDARAAIFLLAVAGTAPAHSAEPLPDQPGVLSTEEIQKAHDAMGRADTELRLLASGKRAPEHPLSQYVVFATPFSPVSSRIESRRQVICNLQGDAWRCSDAPYAAFRVQAHEVEHIFELPPSLITNEAMSLETAADIAEFMYSPCFHARYRDLKGEGITPRSSAYAIHLIGPARDPAQFRVFAGPVEEPDRYVVQEIARGADGCAFTLLEAEHGKSPEQAAREAAHGRETRQLRELETQRRAEQAVIADKAARESQQVQLELLFYAALACGLAALLVPPFAGSFGGWWPSIAAGVLSAGATASFAAYLSAGGGRSQIPIDVLLGPALILLDWLIFAAYVLIALYAHCRAAKMRKVYRILLVGFCGLLFLAVLAMTVKALYFPSPAI